MQSFLKQNSIKEYHVITHQIHSVQGELLW
jgi:hypothetical protein